jgi:trans-aconitate 2-methyltransferase
MTAKWNAHDYHRHSAEQQKWANELIDKLNLKGDEHLLDIGCGDGKVTAAIASRLPGGTVVGVDKSQDMIDFARANFEHGNAKFFQADASSLNFRDEFDVIFSNAALHWIIDHRPVLKGISGALKTSGRALLQMGGRGNAREILAVVQDVSRSPRWREYFSDFAFPYGFYGPEEYRAWLEEAGLHAARIELIPKVMVHASHDAFVGWFRTTWTPWILSVPAAQQTAFINEVTTRYVQSHSPDASGQVRVQMVRLEVDAAKSASAVPMSS